ncbi:helix-turn-helix domain-containing protein [uncultured Roseibium sp.]|uniref:helix-turn-helix domain-containing protein n=1 Tax=uncultured Roseibium sp. TaxID=1936171 RepID=UPI00374CDCE6
MSNLVHVLDEKGAFLCVLDPEVTTAEFMGRMVVPIRGRDADIDSAKGEGVYKGRKKNIDDAEIRKRIAAGATTAQVARDLQVSGMTLYRALSVQVAKSESA